ncbi:TFIIH subunit Tfb4/p34 [Melampsora americana]|nr:TFIIH subunit Tfb4/p34 [Melampsora americana]
MNPFTDPADLLVIILDLNPFAWSDFKHQESLEESIDILSFLESILIFSNSHLSIRHENSLAIYGATIGFSELLYSTIDGSVKNDTKVSSSRDASTYQTFRIVDDAVSDGVKRLMDFENKDVMSGQPVGTVSALAKALCHINRVTKDESKPKDSIKPRILMISISPDSPGQYIPMMNCIFSAQKASIPIDVCKITGEEAVFLQQAAYLTNGIYYRLEKPKALIQYLTMIFLPGVMTRKSLNLPQQEEVDLRAACFCHRKIIDLGYVCSVCLSIFCSPTPVCSTCRTKFPMSTLKRFIAAKPRAKAKPTNNGSQVVSQPNSLAGSPSG